MPHDFCVASGRGDRAGCLAWRGGDCALRLSYGERGESARAWRDGKKLDEIKAMRRDEAASAAGVLGARIEFLDAGDYPLRESAELVDEIVRCYRRVEPAVVLTHARWRIPYNPDHPAAATDGTAGAGAGAGHRL